MSFWLLVVIFTLLEKFFRHRNRPTRPRCFWVHDLLRRQDDLGECTRLVQELRLDSGCFHRYFRMSTEQFDYVLGLVGPHISRLPTYMAVYVHGRTASYDVIRGVNAALVYNRVLYWDARTDARTLYVRTHTHTWMHGCRNM